MCEWFLFTPIIAGQPAEAKEVYQIPLHHLVAPSKSWAVATYWPAWSYHAFVTLMADLTCSSSGVPAVFWQPLSSPDRVGYRVSGGHRHPQEWCHNMLFDGLLTRKVQLSLSICLKDTLHTMLSSQTLSETALHYLSMSDFIRKWLAFIAALLPGATTADSWLWESDCTTLVRDFIRANVVC